MDNKENVSPNHLMAIDRLQMYRQLLKEISDIQDSEDVGENTAEMIKTVLQKVNNLVAGTPELERIKNEEETLIDSRLINCSSSILVKCLQNIIVATVTYEPVNFCKQAIELMKTENEQIDFKKLLGDARSIIPETPKISSLLDTFGTDCLESTKNKEPKTKKKKIAQGRVEKKKLEKVATLQQDEQGIEETVRFLENVLKDEYEQNNEQPLSFYDYVIDKRNFETTVENIFHTAFLARDGKAKIEFDKDNNVLIKPTNRKHLKNFRKQEGRNTQTLMHFSMEDWNNFGSEEGILENHIKRLK